MVGARRAMGGVGLIVACFLVSAGLRAVDSGAAIAAEAAARLGGAPAPETEALLAAIREREAALAAVERKMAERQQTLNVAEARLAEQIAAFEAAQKGLEGTLAMADKAAERDIEHMTAVYAAMKPADAARIFGRMDVTFASGLLVRLDPKTAAAILTGMEPEAAYALTVTASSRNAGVPTQ
jgi:flagellar motility protein MotE (MotC chaperone)